VVRHASSPAQPPDAASANADNTKRERQLDASGRADASAMGADTSALSEVRVACVQQAVQSK
jgi:phosphohistidine phosphatase SixA